MLQHIGSRVVAQSLVFCLIKHHSFRLACGQTNCIFLEDIFIHKSVASFISSCNSDHFSCMGVRMKHQLVDLLCCRRPETVATYVECSEFLFVLLLSSLTQLI
jgi:hypothetical protein